MKSIKSALFTKIDLDSDERPKRGVRSVKASRHVRRSKEIANEFPPGIVQVVKTALFQQTETPQSGFNLARNLCAQRLMPPESIARELLDVIKCFHYKNTSLTHFAHLYASALVSASARLVRRNGKTIFGPSTWDDVQVLLSQSTDRAVATSGIRLTHELQTAACGAKLLSLMLKTELLDYNLSSTEFEFNLESLKAKPTVAVMTKQGLRNVLNTVTRHTAKCLLRHAKYLLDSDVYSFPAGQRNHTSCCASEAKTCLDNLGSVICYTAWLFCAEEKVPIEHQTPAFVVRDAFLSELSLGDDTLPKMNRKKKKTFTTKLKLCFLSSLHEQFANPLEEMVGSLIDLEVELDRYHEKAARQESDERPKVINADGGSVDENQLARKSSTPIMVQMQDELVEAYELENKESSVIWVEFVSDGRCEPVSSDRIFRGRKRKPSSAPDHRRLNPRPSSRPTNKKLLFRGKSCRFLTGDKITPLDRRIIREDLSQMETHEKACNRFRTESFISRNHGCSSTRQRSELIIVQRENELVETYELEGKDSCLLKLKPSSPSGDDSVSDDALSATLRRSVQVKVTVGCSSVSDDLFATLLRTDQAEVQVGNNSFSAFNSSEPVGEIINNAIASASAPTPSLAERQNSIDIAGEENLTQYEAPVTDRLRVPSMFATSKNNPQKQTPREIQRLQNHHQLHKHRKIASSFVDRNFMTGESLQLCRHCQRSFSTTSGDLVRHEVSCPAKMQKQQRSELQHIELEEEFQLQGPNSPTQDVVSPHQVQVPRADVGLDLASQDNGADASPNAYYDTYLPKILLESQDKNDFCQLILQRSVDSSDLKSLSHCSMILTKELDILHQISSDVCNRMTTHQGSHWEGSHVLKTLQSLQIKTNQNIVDLDRLISFLRSRITFAPTLAPQQAQLRQQPQNQEQLHGTLQVDPIRFNWAPYIPPILWTPNHSSSGIVPQEAPQWQQPQNQEQSSGTPSVNPTHYNWAPYTPLMSWTPNHSRTVTTPEEQQCQQPQNQEQLLGTPATEMNSRSIIPQRFLWTTPF